MDMICTRCGEPWESDSFHDIAAEKGITYREAIRDFQSRGCVATGWTAQCEDTRSEQPRGAFGLTSSEAAEAMYDLLGDDTDGAMAMLEDFGFA
jgi:hypothetical protein